MNTVEQINDYFTREAERAKAAGEAPRQLRVLVIDDDDRFNEMVKTSMGRSGVFVDVAVDGESGHWLSFTNTYDIILLDLKMTGMDGAETLRKIKKDRPEARVVLCTGHAQSDILKRAMECGPFGVMEKPEDVSRLMEVFKHYNLLRQS